MIADLTDYPLDASALISSWLIPREKYGRDSEATAEAFLRIIEKTQVGMYALLLGGGGRNEWYFSLSPLLFSLLSLELVHFVVNAVAREDRALIRQHQLWL